MEARRKNDTRCPVAMNSNMLDIHHVSEINERNIECRYPDENFLIYKRAKKSFAEKYSKKAEEFRAWIFEKLK